MFTLEIKNLLPQPFEVSVYEVQVFWLGATLRKFFKWPLLELKKLMYILREMNPMFSFIYACFSSFWLKRTCVWKIFGDFQMRINVNFSLQNRKLSLVMGKWSQNLKCFSLPSELRFINSEWVSNLARDVLLFMGISLLMNSFQKIKGRVGWFTLKTFNCEL